MKRARLIIKEITVNKSGEIKNFQIKLPKDVKRIVAVELDVMTVPNKSKSYQETGSEAKTV
jgi:hypothetical protein